MWLFELFKRPYKLKHVKITSLGSGILVSKGMSVLGTIFWSTTSIDNIEVKGFEKEELHLEVFDYCLELISNHFMACGITTPIILLSYDNKDYLKPTLAKRGTKVSSYRLSCRYILHPNPKIDITNHLPLIDTLVNLSSSCSRLNRNLLQNLGRGNTPPSNRTIGNDINEPLDLWVLAPCTNGLTNQDVDVTGMEFYAFPTINLAYRHLYIRGMDDINLYNLYRVLIPENNNSVNKLVKGHDEVLWDSHITSGYLCKDISTLRYTRTVSITVSKAEEELLVESYGDGLVLPHSPVNIEVVNV